MSCYQAATMDQVGMLCGLKATFGQKLSESKTLTVLPKLSYTNFVQQGRLKQTSVNLTSGSTQVAKSGTPGKHLVSASVGVGLQNSETQVSTRVAYTGHFQKYNRSHEVMVDVACKF